MPSLWNRIAPLHEVHFGAIAKRGASRAAVELTVRRDNHDPVLSHLHHLVPDDHIVSRLGIEIKPPERAEYPSEIPLSVLLQIPTLVDHKPSGGRNSPIRIAHNPHP